MTRKILVSAEHQYDVLIGCDWREEVASISADYSRVALVVASSLRKRVEGVDGSHTNISIVEVPDGESGKTAATLESLWKFFGESGLSRGDVVVAIGGGTTTDIAGFAAATWLRGIDWVAVPTTLAGMVDAAIGGKTGMNSEFGKNLIGAFHSPRRVFIDSDWLDSLSDRDFSAGLAEVVKCGFVSDSKIIELVEGNNVRDIRSNLQMVEELIFRAVSFKGGVVSEDFRESYAREVLNFGHTMGHAIEKHSEYTLRHGEAVSIGMVFVAELAHTRGLLSYANVARYRQILHNLHLPISYPLEALPQLIPLLYRDKKVRGTTLRFIVVTDRLEVLRLDDVTESEIISAYERIGA